MDGNSTSSLQLTSRPTCNYDAIVLCLEQQEGNEHGEVSSHSSDSSEVAVIKPANWANLSAYVLFAVILQTCFYLPIYFWMIYLGNGDLKKLHLLDLLEGV